jgi:hypothetical protein
MTAKHFSKEEIEAKAKEEEHEIERQKQQKHIVSKVKGVMEIDQESDV